MVWVRMFCGLVLCVVLVSACSKPSPSPSSSSKVQTTASDPKTTPTPPSKAAKTVPTQPKIPMAQGPFSPSLATLHEGHTFQKGAFRSSKECATCHTEIAQEWSQSMHRFSSFNNAIYTVSFDDFVADAGHEKAPFCNGCHEPHMQFRAEKAEVKPSDPEAYVGVDCAVCHSATHATTNGNASYTLRTDPITAPNVDDPKSVAAHKERANPAALRTDALCVSCHRGFLSSETGHDAVIQGIDEFGSWRRSPYAGRGAGQIDETIQPQSCTGCHMPSVPSKDGDASHRSHRFPGGHTTVANAISAEDQHRAVRALLQNSATLDILPMRREGGAARVVDNTDALQKDQPLLFDVVIFNANTGHHFPGGTRDLKDTWVEIKVLDSSGTLVAQSGVDHETTMAERDAHRLRAMMLSDTSNAVEEHSVASFRTPIFDRTIPPRDAAIARFRLDQPPSDTLHIQVTLRHRRIQGSMMERVCASTKTDRGAAFLLGTQSHNGITPDWCATQPIFDIATASLWVGTDAATHRAKNTPQTQRPQARRLWEHALGLRHHVQEHLDETRITLEAAHKISSSSPSWLRASILAELARTLGKQGRTDDALRIAEKAEALAPKHPALDRIRAESLAQVWRWEDAARAWARVTDAVPRDDRGWRGLSRALGSLGQREDALIAAQRGLELEPRDPHLLRSQSLAFAKLQPDTQAAKDAQSAWLNYRRDEASSTIQGRCSDPKLDCQRERVPILTRILKPAKP